MVNIITLSQIINDIEKLDDNLIIYAHRNPVLEMDSQAVLIYADEFDEVDVTEILNNMTYLLEVNIAKEVLEVWRRWRDGKTPTELEKFNAIIYYAENDAYIRDEI